LVDVRGIEPPHYPTRTKRDVHGLGAETF